MTYEDGVLYLKEDGGLILRRVLDFRVVLNL